MKWYKDRPDEGDFVVVKITDIQDNSAYADLEKYEDLEGLIHISEVSRSWVQDVGSEIDEGEKTVAQVLESDDGSLNLSLKRVNDKNKRDAMEKWKKERKAESFLEGVSERLEMDLDEVYEEIGFPMQRKFGTSFRGFEISEAEEEKLLEILSEEQVEAVKEVAREKITMRQEKLEGTMEMSFPQEDGVERIKSSLSGVQEDGVEVSYLSAPEYSITAWGRTQDLAKKRIDEAVRSVRSAVEDRDGSFNFSRG